MNSLHSSSPLILRVPNEIHHHIFSCLYDLSRDEPFLHYRLNGKDYEVSQMLVLRCVCRHFRTLTAELDFWYDPDFEFTDLIRPFEHGEFGPLYRETEFLRVLFSDPNLVNSLGQRKTHWVFKSLQGLMAVLEGVPLFVQNARGIHLEIMDSIQATGLDIAIRLLAACSQITELSTRSADTINLSAIAASFPFLRSLSCPETDNFRGSLEQLSHLRTLHLSAWKNRVLANQPWLPLRSAETLNELNLNYGPNVDTAFFNPDSLRAFVNLKSLAIQYLNESFCEFIIGARIQLDIFDITLIQRRLPIHRFVDMLRADCLQNLKELGLSNFLDDESNHNATEQYWSRIFDAFTSMLPSVEEVQLDTPLHLKWCPYFARMSNLKILNWDGSGNPPFGCGRTGNPKAKIVRKLNAAFANFIEKPQFAVHLMWY